MFKADGEIQTWIKNETSFEALNQKLAQANTLTIICVGGYVLEHHGLQSNPDM